MLVGSSIRSQRVRSHDLAHKAHAFFHAALHTARGVAVLSIDGNYNHYRSAHLGAVICFRARTSASFANSCRVAVKRIHSRERWPRANALIIICCNNLFLLRRLDSRSKKKQQPGRDRRARFYFRTALLHLVGKYYANWRIDMCEYVCVVGVVRLWRFRFVLANHK